MNPSRNSTRLAGVAVTFGIAAIGCGTSTTYHGGDQPPGSPDLAFVFQGGGDDAAVAAGDDAGQQGGPNACGDTDPSCNDVVFDPGMMVKFPLGADKPADPLESDEGVGRDANGYLFLDQTHASFDFLWVANSGDIGGLGTTSKFNSKTVREVARYRTVTCNSLKTGGSMQCDGKNGCCAMDSYPQWQNRQAKMPSGPAQQVQLMSNAPSRTSVDFNGDMWISNRAFGGQSSVTKIANDPGACIDRNHNNKIETSKDTNGDGVIQLDCNGNGIPDDIDDVKATPCTNKMQQEFYNLDDECILFTTNTFPAVAIGRPLTLGPGAQDFGPSDAWPGSFQLGKFLRVDGTSGQVKDEVQLPNECYAGGTGPYGAVVDSSGFGWTGLLSRGPLCYWDTKNSKQVGSTRMPQVGSQTPYGIGLDRDQNIWQACLGFGACRYTPDRSKGFASLGMGYYTMISQPGQQNGGGYAIGMAVDSRSPQKYFAWVAGGSVVARIPASDIPVPKGQDVMVDGAMYPAVPIAGDGKGVGVDRDQNVWNASGSGTSGVTRILVDVMGNMTKPDVQSQPMGNNLCPAGDRCPHKGNNQWDPQPYTYSDFTGFGLRNFTRPKGSWSYVVRGCVDSQDASKGADTKWVSVSFQADTPLNTAVSVRARSGNTAMPDPSWGVWSMDQKTSPVDLQQVLTPNFHPGMMDAANDGWLQIEVDLSTSDQNKTPKLRKVEVTYECPGKIG